MTLLSGQHNKQANVKADHEVPPGEDSKVALELHKGETAKQHCLKVNHNYLATLKLC